MSEEPQVTPEVEEPGTDNADIKVGIIVGVREDDSFVFEPIGNNPSLIELFGLVEFATWQLNQWREGKLEEGKARNKTDQMLMESVALSRVIVKTLAQMKKDSENPPPVK